MATLTVTYAQDVVKIKNKLASMGCIMIRADLHREVQGLISHKISQSSEMHNFEKFNVQVRLLAQNQASLLYFGGLGRGAQWKYRIRNLALMPKLRQENKRRQKIEEETRGKGRSGRDTSRGLEEKIDLQNRQKDLRFYYQIV